LKTIRSRLVRGVLNPDAFNDTTVYPLQRRGCFGDGDGYNPFMLWAIKE